MTKSRGCWAIDHNHARLLYFESTQERGTFTIKDPERFEMIAANHGWVVSMYNSLNHTGKQRTKEEFMGELSPSLPPALQ